MIPKEEKFNRSEVEDLLKRRFFYAPSFEIYGGIINFKINFRVNFKIYFK